MGRRKGLREQMFEAGANAVDAFAAGHGHGRLYLCPLCVRGFRDPAELTVEDVPPKAIGGRPLCLTCRECNSRAGHELDAHVVREMNAVAFTIGADMEDAVPAKVTIGGVTQRTNLRFSGGTLYTEGVPQAGPPETVDRMVAALERLVDGQTEGNIEVTFEQLWSPARVRIGWLRHAYLVTFAAFGYRYILRPELEPVRHLIAHPDESQFPAAVFVDADAPLDRRQILRTDTDPCQGVHIAIGNYRALLPALEPDPSYAARVERLVAESAGQVHLTFDVLPWPDRATYLFDHITPWPPM